ncbi:MAG TPA: cupin domain-containing protein [Actinomycetota bacterium]|nr:cupin domain-containing protein [Actinomycetota bacterium]
MNEIAGAFRVSADGGERLQFGGIEIRVRVSESSTGRAYSIIEEVDPVDTPLHVHQNEDELWYILEGQHVIQVGDEEFPVGPGDIAFAPRGVPHSQRRVVERTGRFLVVYSPGGFEGFFRELADAERNNADMSSAYAAASKKYGITWL